MASPTKWGAPGDLTDKVAVVTGAGRGIGRDVALAYAAAGATVVCAARSAAELQGTVAAIEQSGGCALAQPTDVADDAAVNQLFEVAVDRFGGLDVVMLNAGVTGDRCPLATSEPARWRIPIEVNLFGAYLCARAAIPHLRARGGGKIILMGSGARLKPLPELSAYAVSKIGAWMLMRAMAQELRADRIAVNEIIPGPVNTGLMRDAPRLFPLEWFKDPADVARFAVFVATLPDDGPTGRSFSLLARDSSS